MLSQDKMYYIYIINYLYREIICSIIKSNIKVKEMQRNHNQNSQVLNIYLRLRDLMYYNIISYTYIQEGTSSTNIGSDTEDY